MIGIWRREIEPDPLHDDPVGPDGNPIPGFYGRAQREADERVPEQRETLFEVADRTGLLHVRISRKVVVK